MKIIYGLDQVDPPIPRCVLTVGNFDGVHVGHQEIIRHARSLAVPAGDPVVALTFDPHPLAVVAPAKAPLHLMALPERVHRLAQAGADTVVVAHSDRGLLSMEAERFIRDVLMARFHPLHIVEGPTFGFGKGRKGNPQLLREVTKPLGCETHIVEPVAITGDDGRSLPVSSSCIRQLLLDGDVALAARCLGRPYTIESTVVHGAARGRSLGYATANIVLPDGQVEPGEGVYAGTTVVRGKPYASAISIGRAETFGKNKRQIETHLLDFEGDLYEKAIRVEFVQRIRGQMKFATVAALVDQIRQDVQSVRSAIRVASTES